MARENNVTAEQFLKYIGASYWQVMDDFLSYLNNTQGQFTINRWASSENSKVLQFNQKLYYPGTETVAASLES